MLLDHVTSVYDYFLFLFSLITVQNVARLCDVDLVNRMYHCFE